MAHSIRELIGKVPDVNAGNRYKVEIFLPDALKGWNKHLDKIQFYCKECSLPENGITQIENRVYGQKRMLGSFKQDGTTTTSFIFDYRALNVKLFNFWLDYIIKPDTKRLEYYENYIGRVRITLLSNLNKVIYVCNLEEAYPLRVNEIPLSYSQNELLPLEIEWWYRSRTYSEDIDEAEMIESSIKEGIIAKGEQVKREVQAAKDVVNKAITDGQNIANKVNEAADRIKTIGRIFDIYGK